MREIRLFVAAPMQPGLDLTLPDAAAQHAIRVLRLAAGDALTLFNGDGHQYPAHLLRATTRQAEVRIGSVESPERESPLRITLVQALARGEKMDWIVQKATELGVARIVPVVSARSEVKLDATRSGKRLEHWRAIAIAACEQSGRNCVPRIDAPTTLAAWIAADDGAPDGTRWLLLPDAESRMRNAAPSTPQATLAVGPEGGFADTDIDALRQAGYQALALGPRILRTETAGLAALAALQALYGDF